jgi:hypothetical protein
MTAKRPSSGLEITRREALSAAGGAWVAASGLQSAMAQEGPAVRIQLDQQALNAVPGDERAGLEVREDTSSTAQDLKARSSPGKTLPIIYLIVGILSLPSIRGVVQEMLRHREYGGVAIDTRTSPANIRSDLTAQADSVVVVRADGSTESVPSTLVTEDFLRRVLRYE